MKKNLITAVLMTVATTVLLGIVYPLVVTVIARVIFPDKASGQLIQRDGKTVGSRIIGQPFTGPGYFQSRLSAAGTNGYDAANSAGSNLGPTNKALIDRVRQSAESLQAENPGKPVPVDGTGKSLLARMLHRSSPRRIGPFVEFRCALLPESVVEAELFGAEGSRRGAAPASGPGRFELADGGTLVLDDVAGLSPALRERVLHAEATGRLDGTADGRAVDVRLVLTLPASGGAADGGVLSGLPAVSVQVPALRERVGDILLLADHFLRMFRSKHRRRVREFTPEALGSLVRYQWPGNVTELRNAVEHAVILTRNGVITAAALPPGIANGGQAGGRARAGTLPLRDALREPERCYILRALDAMGWNKQHAAQKLRISRSTLYKKMKELGLDREELLSGTGGAH